VGEEGVDGRKRAACFFRTIAGVAEGCLPLERNPFAARGLPNATFFK